MSERDVPADTSQSISAAELRRRLMASTPPPIAAPDLPEPAVGSIAARSRLLMPGMNGPVAASSVPPVAEQFPIPEVNLPSRSRFLPMDAATLPVAITTPEPADPAPHQHPGKSADDYKRIKQENRELRKLLDEMKQLLQEASDNEQKAAAREADLAVQLATKSRLTDEMSAQLMSIEEQLASGALSAAPPVPKTRTELEEWADDLEREAANINKARRELDDERKQLREDEQGLEYQMRQMEVGMAKERAMMARQETELKRLSAEIQHELELMQRGDATLREQLSKFQRRAADVMQARAGPPPGGKR